MLKLTQEDHPDLETLPLILSILNEFVKSTQPGIAAAESKVKFWNLCENLVYMKGEIIVSPMDLLYSLVFQILSVRKWTCMMIAGPLYIPGPLQGVPDLKWAMGGST